jgi:integrase
VRSDFGRIRAFLRWIAARKDVPALFNVCRGIDQPKEEETTAEAPSVEKVRAILRVLYESGHPWMGDYVRLLVETGMRPSELLGLRGVDVRGKLVSIAPWEGRLLKSRWSKRTIEVNEAAAGILKARLETMLDKQRPIFMTELGTVYQARSVAHLLKELLAGGRGNRVPRELDLALYDLRHFFASEHAAPGPSHMAIEALGAYLGHSPSSIKVLLRWYVDQNALRRGAPASVLGEPRGGKILELGR